MEKQFRYEQIAAKVQCMIFDQKLQPGDKIPSVRFISRELGVSPATVAQAYDLLDAKGVLVPKPKSGFYVAPKSKKKFVNQDDLSTPFEPIEIRSMVTLMAKNMRKHNVIDFSSLGPSQELLPISRLHKALFQSTKEVLNGNFKDAYHQGSPKLRNQIALHAIKWSQTSITPGNMLITNGCMEAISLCLDVSVRSGETVVVESPTYECILQCLENKGIKSIGIPVDPQLGLDLDALERIISTNKIAAGIFSPSCQSLLGCTMSENAKLRLIDLMESNNIPFIEDDALGEMYFGTSRSLPAKAYDKSGNIMYCSSFSKTLTPGFRIGWVSGGRYHELLERFKFATNISTNTLLQDTLGRYLESGNYPIHLKKLRRTVRDQVTKYHEVITDSFPATTKVSQPQGGFSLWIELPVGINGLELQSEALKQRIGLYPGEIFSTSHQFRQCVRINCGKPFNSKIENALRELGVLVNVFLNKEYKVNMYIK